MTYGQHELTGSCWCRPDVVGREVRHDTITPHVPRHRVNEKPGSWRPGLTGEPEKAIISKSSDL